MTMERFLEVATINQIIELENRLKETNDPSFTGIIDCLGEIITVRLPSPYQIPELPNGAFEIAMV
ncbi:hypothetical protein [Paenibacillus contaminans]|uniref:Uncharacterized protein n=1 Tax=Paenibacillus contaminans TaxID=450362 RepID=A0A329MR05_9BACL|nr:hypothetical protein [Paenibacillus contaminans]RAV22224.1 hypothetical protein DQG23_04535 [Paenibacillus contaminans]